MSSSTQSGLKVARLIELRKFLKRWQKSEHAQVPILLFFHLQRDLFHGAGHTSPTGQPLAFLAQGAGNSMLGWASPGLCPCVCSCVSHAGAVTLSNLIRVAKAKVKG